MLTALAIAASLLTAPSADKWTIKPDFSAKSKPAWTLHVDVKSPEPHEATMNLSRTTKDPVEGKPITSAYAWTDLKVDGNTVVEDSTWDVSLDARGGILSTEASEGDDIRR